MDAGKIVILYGSQTGTAQDVAERIWREAKRFRFHGPVQCMDDYPVENLIYELIVVFVCSTTGQGEEPDNMKKFWKFLLRKSLPSNSLHRVHFAVLGLGDSSYIKFNFAAKRLARRLANLGGTPLIDTGLADDQHDLGIDAVVDSWIEKLWSAVCKLYNVSVGSVKEDYIPSSRWNVELVDQKKLDSNRNKSSNSESTYSQKHPCKLTLVSNKRTTTETHFQDVRLLEFKKPNDLSYQPGDVLMLVPQNSSEKVDRFFQILNNNRPAGKALKSSDVIQLTGKDSDMPVPELLQLPIQFSECVKKYWDLNAVPRRYTFTILSHFTTSEMEKEKLQEFSQAEGQEELYDYCNRPKRNILEVLSDFPCATQNITLEFLFEILQPIRPRAFSIASSPTLHPNIQILLAVVQYKTRLFEKRFGLCSTYLANSKINSTVYGWIRKGSFRFPPPETPVIMVGPGTGVAPFRSYINELVALGKASKEQLLLFFGCRNRNADFHCRDEWENLQNNNNLKLFCAFSREQADKVSTLWKRLLSLSKFFYPFDGVSVSGMKCNGVTKQDLESSRPSTIASNFLLQGLLRPTFVKKKYVQHVLIKEGKSVWKLLKTQKAYIFVAGNSKNMPQSVRESFIEVIKRNGEMSRQEAEIFLSSMEKSGRYQTETWG